MRYFACLMLLIAFSATAKTPNPPSNMYQTGSNQCGMVLNSMQPIFCYTFDHPFTNGIRQGQLDSDVWGVSRSQDTNFGQQWYNLWNPVTLIKCDGTTPTVLPPSDIIICNGQLREANNDNLSGGLDDGDVLSMAMYPKQRFDFTGRTGTISFDVSNDGGPHGAWPEFWLSDLPVPDPFNHFDSWISFPQHSFGLRFDQYSSIGTQGVCPNANNLNQLRFTVESASASRNYVYEDTLGFGTQGSPPMAVTVNDCVISSNGPGNMNHIEIRISQNQTLIYATDAGVKATPSTLRLIATVTNQNLSFTNGLVWLEDVHYNGSKILDMTRPSEAMHTFSWDNLAFDGGFEGRDFAFDAPDMATPPPDQSNSFGAVSLGQFSYGGQTSTWNIANVPASPNPAAVKVLFNFYHDSQVPTVINLAVNGHTHSAAWPFPDQVCCTIRTFNITVPVTDLVTGTNVVQLGTDAPVSMFNVDIVLANVPGAVPVLPGSNNTYAAAFANASSSSGGGSSSSSSGSSSSSSSSSGGSSSSSSSGSSSSSSSGSSSGSGSGATAVWTNVTPSNASLTGSYSCSNYGAQSVQPDPQNPGVVYVNFDCQGIWKSTDYGQTWTGPINTGTLGATVGDCASGFTLAPNATAGGAATLMTGCIRGNGTGFNKSTDNGVDWTHYVIGLSSARQDYFPPVVDPYDSTHLILNAHEFDSLMQSTDGGQTWSAINLNSGMLTNGGTGDVFFINTGTASTTRTTWLWLAQGSGGTYGTWRTTNGGTSWTKVDNNEHVFGNGQIYQPDTSGVVYMAGQYSALGYGVLRSTDYGQTWAHVGPTIEENGVVGTSKNIYASDNAPVGVGNSLAPNFQYVVVPGTGTWTSPGTPSGLTDGASQIGVMNDGTHNILVGAMWNAGVWRYVEP